MPTYEGLRLKALKVKRKAFAKSRKKHLKDTSFTVISNNCWGECSMKAIIYLKSLQRLDFS